jgi:hypothetical protein
MGIEDSSTNRLPETNEAPKLHLEPSPPSRHPDLCFKDGNLAVLTGGHYFLVHQGLLCRHSDPLAATIKALEEKQDRFLEGRVVLELPDASNDVYYFLLALYDGMYVIQLLFAPFVLKIHSSALKYDTTDFGVVSAILRLAAKYEVKHIRNDLIRGLSSSYPKTLVQWETREAMATSPSGDYDPRKTIPHPM